MDKGYDEAIIPVEIMMKPLEKNSEWYPMRDKIKSWGLENKTIGLETLMPRYQSEFLKNLIENANEL